MRISDWSSDVCSSDLAALWRSGGGSPRAVRKGGARADPQGGGRAGTDRAGERALAGRGPCAGPHPRDVPGRRADLGPAGEPQPVLGRAGRQGAEDQLSRYALAGAVAEAGRALSLRRTLGGRAEEATSELQSQM